MMKSMRLNIKLYDSIIVLIQASRHFRRHGRLRQARRRRRLGTLDTQYSMARSVDFSFVSPAQLPS